MDTQLAELPFFTNLLILLVGARLLGEVFERFHQPSMIGEILAGILLGPAVFNLVHRTEEIQVISELGVFLLVIIAGLEIHIDDILKSMNWKGLLISMAAFFVPIGGGIAVGYLFGQDVLSTAFIGLCIAITALPVTVRILMDLGKLNSALGQKIISIAIFDDVLALTILGVLLHTKDSEMTVSAVTWIALVSLMKLLIFLLILTASYYALRYIIRKGNYIEVWLDRLLKIVKGKESLFALFFIFILIFSTITETLGFHFIIGAFFAAMLISENVVGEAHVKTIEKTTSGLAIGFLAPIFFAGIGLEFKFSSIHNYGLLAAVLGVSFFSKIIGGFIGGRLAGMPARSAFALGVGLNARGIMELVIANIAYKAEIISLEIFSILVIMGVFTTLTTPFMLKRSFRRLERKEAELSITDT